MLSCKFIISREEIEILNSFLEESGLYNVSIFENTNYGFSEDFDENGFPVTKFFDIEIFLNDKNEAKNLQEILNNRFSQNIQNFQINDIDNKNWVDLYLKELKPITLGNFYFYNDSIQNTTCDSNLIPIKLNSALAFGSGHHQTTQGCIFNAEFLKNNAFCPVDILDMGCGTGILGICALKLWQNANLLGIDIDPEAVKITLDNYRANDLKANTIVASDLSVVNENFDLILCNILKQPLLELSQSFYEKLNINGYIITSGFIKTQELDIINRYQTLGFKMINRILMDDWLSILFRK